MSYTSPQEGPEDPEERVHGLLDTHSEERQMRGLDSIFLVMDQEDERGKEKDDYRVDVSPSLWEDLALGSWAAGLTITRGGARDIQERLAKPTTDLEVLQDRASHAQRLVPAYEELRGILAHLAVMEPSLLWAFDLPPIHEAWPVEMLYPTWPILRLLNTIPPLISLFHVFRGYISPALALAHPIGAILGPWFYVRRTLGWKLSLASYARMLFVAFRAAAMPSPSGSPSQNTLRLSSVILYVGLFIYGIVQSFQLAAILRQVSGGLVARADTIRGFVTTARELLVRVYKDLPIFPSILPGPAGAYQIWTDRDLRDKLRSVARAVYRADTLVATAGLLRQGWNIPVWHPAPADQDIARVHGLRHPRLPHTQVSNPLSLARSLLVTGPNAAGKTTYMKAVAAAFVCAQSLGIVYARRARLSPVHALGSFVRVSDEVGTASLFEAEALRCARLLASAKATSDASHRALYLLDEPMHSTPPTEGAAMAYAVLRHLGLLPGVRAMVTTHYHRLSILAEEAPDHFHNISMTAQGPDASGAFAFPYRVQRGASSQCIAIQLLGDKGLPEEVTATALKMQESFCAG